MNRREHIRQLVAKGELTPDEARILLEALSCEEPSPFAPLEGAGVTEPPPAPNPSSRRTEPTLSPSQSFQPLFFFLILEA